MDKENSLLIQALRRSVEGTAFDLPQDINWERFLRLTAAHNVEGLVYDGLKDHPLPEVVKNHFSGATNRAIFLDVQQSYIYTQLHQALADADIPHIFLKGAVLKHDYPIPTLRTMCDMDVLVQSQDFAALDKVATALGGTYSSGDGNHKNYSFPGGVVVEFHPNLLHHATPVAAAVNPGWQYATKDESGCYQLTEEGFYLCIMTHIASHFVHGGIGVRFVLDVWIFLNRRKKPMDRAFVEKELTRFQLLDFAKNIERLAGVWFDGAATDATMEELGEYILTSGVHGIYSRQLLNAMTRSGSRWRTLWRKAFYPRQELEDRFPWAKNRPLLLPAAWLARVYNTLTKHGDLVVSWSKDTGNISQADIIKQKEKLNRFGIKCGKEA